MVFGLATGYKFSSFRLFSFVWIKEDGKIVIKKSRNSPVLGQCLMAPPENEKDFRLYGIQLLDKAKKESESIPNQGQQAMEKDYIAELERYMAINEQII